MDEAPGKCKTLSTPPSPPPSTSLHISSPLNNILLSCTFEGYFETNEKLNWAQQLMLCILGFLLNLGLMRWNQDSKCAHSGLEQQ